MIDEILLDMDGVLTDFQKAMCKTHNKTSTGELYSLEEEWGISADEFWEPANNEDFWVNLEPFPETEEVIKTCLEYTNNVSFCTTPAKSPYCASGKIKWINKWMDKWGFPLKRNYHITTKKESLSRPNTILVDDKKSNIERFVNNGRGGCGLLWPVSYNLSDVQTTEFDGDKIKFLKSNIEFISEFYSYYNNYPKGGFCSGKI